MLSGSYPDQMLEQPIDPTPPVQTMTQDGQSADEWGTVEFGFADPAPPEVRLAKMKSEARGRAQEISRRKDSVALPAIEEDMAKSILHQQQLDQRLQEAQQKIQSLVAPVYQPGQLDDGDYIATALSGLLGGAEGFNQATEGAYGRADQLAGQRYKEAGMQYQQNREDAESQMDFLRSQYDSQTRMLQVLKAKQLEALMAEDEATRAEARDNLKAAMEMEKLLQEQKGNLELEKERQKGRIDVQKIGVFKSTFKDMDPKARDDAAKALGISDDPNYLQAIQELSIAEKEKVERTKNLVQLREYNTRANPARIQLMNAQRDALLSLVPLRDAQAKHTIADIDRIMSIVELNNKRAAYIDDEFNLDLQKHLFEVEKFKMQGEDASGSIDRAVSVYDAQIKAWGNKLSELTARARQLEKQREDPMQMTSEEAAIEDEMKAIKEKIDWAEKKKIELEADKPQKKPNLLGQASAAVKGALSGFRPIQIDESQLSKRAPKDKREISGSALGGGTELPSGWKRGK